MAISMRAGAATRQPMAVDQVDVTRSTSVDQSLDALRQVVVDLGYSLDALEAAMGKDRSFINKVLNGDKPMPADFIDALPDDIEAEWHARRAASFGRFVVTPASDDSAVQQFVGGLLTLLRLQRCELPARASSMAKVEQLPTRSRKTA